MADETRPTRLFELNEGDLWRLQLEKLAALTKFIKDHGPGRPGALPVVPWQIDTGLSAVARLSTWMTQPDGSPLDVVAVLEAYAKALGTDVIKNKADTGEVDYWVKGTIGERGRVKLTLTATVRPDDVDTED